MFESIDPNNNKLASILSAYLDVLSDKLVGCVENIREVSENFLGNTVKITCEFISELPARSKRDTNPETDFFILKYLENLENLTDKLPYTVNKNLTQTESTIEDDIVDACGNHGCNLANSICVDSLSNDPTAYTCQCQPGYTGLHCDELVDNCPVNACFSHGKCVNGVNTFSCECDLLFEGEFCQDSKCQNGGSVKNHKCQCPKNFYGSLCQYEEKCLSVLNPNSQILTLLDEKDDYCLGRGTCSTIENTAVCLCQGLFYGDRCQYQHDCLSDTDCGNQGICQYDSTDGEYFCKCQGNFSGSKCQIEEICPEDVVCQNGGTCRVSTTGYYCECVPSFNGKFCENGEIHVADREIPGATASSEFLKFSCLTVFAIFFM